MTDLTKANAVRALLSRHPYACDLKKASSIAQRLAVPFDLELDGSDREIKDRRKIFLGRRNFYQLTLLVTRTPEHKDSGCSR